MRLALDRDLQADIYIRPDLVVSRVTPHLSCFLSQLIYELFSLVCSWFELFFFTGHPPSNQIAKTALDAQDHVPWEYREDILSVLKELKAKNYQIVTLEQAEGSFFYEDFRPEGPLCLVVGNEVEGVSQDVLSYCDKAIEIEMAGIKNSLNVAVAFGIIAYHFRGCLKQ